MLQLLMGAITMKSISVNDNTYTLEVGKLSGGTIEHYIHHLENTINNIASLYSTFTNTEKQEVLNKFKETINSTHSDSAPVNSCVSSKLSEIFSKPLVKLHCNLHHLDGLASEAKKVLKKIDEADGIKSQIFCTEGKTANLIYAVSKLRYKMNSGDPAGFKSFLRLSNIKSGVIARYVGNRLHILFHLAGVIIHLKDFLCIFLKNYCKDNPFRLALLQDLMHPAIIRQLRILGLFGKLMIGPWMTMF